MSLMSSMYFITGNFDVITYCNAKPDANTEFGTVLIDTVLSGAFNASGMLSMTFKML